ncbi:MAG: winged helix-turn-helix domain-containing protein [Pseudacidovorax sp.]|nr:winged helix-turn-helix domain-containing protein [Pseudacidovorax sp.]
MNIALLEDDPDQRDLATLWLSHGGHQVTSFGSTGELIRELGSRRYDLLVLDWTLPDGTGGDVLTWLRNRPGVQPPAIVLTSRDEEAHVVEGLNSGADDYLVKPARPAELLARISALSRRARTRGPQVLELNGYRVDLVQHRIAVDGTPVDLTQKEFDLAVYLFQNPGVLLSREHLLNRVWGKTADVTTRTVDTHISRLRRKLRLDGQGPLRLTPVYGQGYRLDAVEPAGAEVDTGADPQAGTALHTSVCVAEPADGQPAACADAGPAPGADEAAGRDTAAAAGIDCCPGVLAQGGPAEPREVLDHLARAARFRDGETAAHMVRVGFLAWALALAAGCSPEAALLLRQAAPMHDVGKIGVADALLKHPGRFSSDQHRQMEAHTVMGAEILGGSDLPLLRLAAEIALTHHERWDGGGYPRGLRGDAIPLPGRITALVDFFDATVSERRYRARMKPEEVLRLLHAQSGAAFDPTLVSIFIRHGERMARVCEQVMERGLGFDALSDPQALDFAALPVGA